MMTFDAAIQEFSDAVHYKQLSETEMLRLISVTEVDEPMNPMLRAILLSKRYSITNKLLFNIDMGGFDVSTGFSHAVLVSLFMMFAYGVAIGKLMFEEKK